MDKWNSVGESVLPKIHLDKLLLIIRAFIILIWIVAMWLSVKIELEIQMFFVTIIFLSDAFDGMFSRHFTLPKEQYQFRILDSTVDKLGILLFLSTLLYFKQIDISSFLVIIGYNILLILFPIIYITGKFTKEVDWIQATIWSRFYAVSVGIFCFVSTISDFVLKYSLSWNIYFSILGIVSFISHIDKVKKIEGEV